MSGGALVVAVCDHELADGRSSRGNVARLREACAAAGRPVTLRTYRELLERGLPDLAGATALAVLFFPYAHWNTAIEHADSRATYGGLAYLRALQAFLADVDTALASAPAADVLNPPGLLATVRDKVAVKRRWTEAAVPTPAWRPLGDDRRGEVDAALRDWGVTYVKSRCSSNTKGISVLEAGGRWRSNFRVEGGRLVPPSPAGDGFDDAEEWRFADVTPGDTAFLAALSGDDCFLEAGVTGPGRRVEARVWIVGTRARRVDVLIAPPGSATAGTSEGGGRAAAPATVPGAGAIDGAAATAGVAAAAALGIRFGVIDVLIDGDGRAWAVDAQAFPPPRTDREMWMEVLAT